MFIKYDNNAVRLTGRWYQNGNTATATARGSKIEFSCCGNMVVMHLYMTFSEQHEDN